MPRGRVDEREMFSYLTSLAKGKMAVGVSLKGGLMVPVDPIELAGMGTWLYVRPFTMREVAMKNRFIAVVEGRFASGISRHDFPCEVAYI
jgi:hypothetical protein